MLHLQFYESDRFIYRKNDGLPYLIRGSCNYKYLLLNLVLTTILNILTSLQFDLTLYNNYANRVINQNINILFCVMHTGDPYV